MCLTIKHYRHPLMYYFIPFILHSRTEQSSIPFALKNILSAAIALATAT